MALRPASFASIAIWGLAALLAIAAGASSFAWAARQRSPSVAAGVWPVNGFGLPELVDDATQIPAAAVGSQTSLRIAPELGGLAREALSAETTSAAAVRALALRRHQEGDRDGALALMRLASRLTRRDEIVNLWLVNHELRAGQLDSALARYDVTLRTIGDRRGYVMAAMAAALSDPRLVDPFYRLLRTNPPWAAEFWNVAAQTPPALDNAARLRIRLARSGTAVPPDKDDLLLGALVEQQRFDQAFELERALGRAAVAGDDPANGEFAREPRGSPLDWQLTSSGEAGASIDGRSSVLQISAAGGASSQVARKLVRLDPARYRLEVALTEDSPGLAAEQPSAPLRAELLCAERTGSYPPLRLAVAARSAAGEIDLSRTRCRYHWITLSVEATDAPQGLDLLVDFVRLRRMV